MYKDWWEVQRGSEGKSNYTLKWESRYLGSRFGSAAVRPKSNQFQEVGGTS